MIGHLGLRKRNIESGTVQSGELLVQGLVFGVEAARQRDATGLGEIGDTLCSRVVVVQHRLGEILDRLVLRFLAGQLGELDLRRIADRELLEDYAVRRIQLVRRRHAGLG